MRISQLSGGQLVLLWALGFPLIFPVTQILLVPVVLIFKQGSLGILLSMLVMLVVPTLLLAITWKWLGSNGEALRRMHGGKLAIVWVGAAAAGLVFLLLAGLLSLQVGAIATTLTVVMLLGVLAALILFTWQFFSVREQGE